MRSKSNHSRTFHGRSEVTGGCCLPLAQPKACSWERMPSSFLAAPSSLFCLLPRPETLHCTAVLSNLISSPHPGGRREPVLIVLSSYLTSRTSWHVKQELGAPQPLGNNSMSRSSRKVWTQLLQPDPSHPCPLFLSLATCPEIPGHQHATSLSDLIRERGPVRSHRSRWT